MFPTATDYGGTTHKISRARRDARTGMHEVKTSCGMEISVSGLFVDLYGNWLVVINCEICQEKL